MEKNTSKFLRYDDPVDKWKLKHLQMYLFTYSKDTKKGLFLAAPFSVIPLMYSLFFYVHLKKDELMLINVDLNETK